ncbi:hypothetical protein CERZMDRAFT_103965 [Cercospora zeae-maydis SCOH1-5]|uniref:Uncharacterized protein n=1 Tax=Cercospora zeae-maydis SCOH1-5 TaxID=717836 RepID=A0A6A6EUZ7_9PEZI|nr:hypothetical protein CERZMDRAFT_103965 [Cercospora zeae-maydis SCOH1-5]
MAATDRPLPPLLPETEAEFAEHVTTHPDACLSAPKIANSARLSTSKRPSIRRWKPNTATRL